MSTNTVINQKGKNYHVVMLDTFMSYWGSAIIGANWYIVNCDNIHQANRIAKNAKKRKEMKHIGIHSGLANYKDTETRINSIRHFNDLGEVWTEAN